MFGDTLRVFCVAMLLALPCVACSDDDEDEPEVQSGTCNGATGPFSTCSEFTGDPSLIADEKHFCIQDGDTWTTDPCPTMDLLGCCRSTLGSDVYLDCYYTGYPQTAMELEQDCIDFLQGTFTTGARG